MAAKNPFIVMGKIPNEYFCDRVEETRKLTQYISGQSTNVLLMSGRRIGKTGLIDHVYDQPEIAGEFYTFYFDILHTSNLQEFAYELGKEVIKRILPRGQKTLQSLLQAIRSISPKFSIDPFSGMPTLALEVGSITQPEYTIDEIFGWLEHADKPCIVAIDEFQRILKYQEKNVEALLRGKIQHMSNCHFIFSGSERHLLEEMFHEHKRPFYNSTTSIPLEPITKDIYRDFATSLFEQSGRKLDAEAFNALYRHFEGNTFCIQKILHNAYNMVDPGETCDKQILLQCLRDILAENTRGYKESLSRMAAKHKAVLVAIALEGKAEKVTSGAFLRAHKLESASMVQTALRTLLDSEWVTVQEKVYSVSDQFLMLWLQQQNGMETTFI